MKVDITGGQNSHFYGDQVTSSTSWRYRHEGGIHSNAHHEHLLRTGRGQHLLQGTLELNASQHLLLCKEPQILTCSI